MTEDELKKELRKKLGRNLNQATWGYLVGTGDVADALAHERPVDDLFDVYLAVEPRFRTPAKSRAIPPDLRATALAVLVAKRAERLDYVQSFRREVLRGRLLKADRVRAWIERCAERDKADTKESGPASEMLRYFSEGDEWVERIRLDGKLGRLKHLAQKLQEKFPFWPEVWAVQFVLTGEAPPPINGRVKIHRIADLPALGYIEIRVSPRVFPSDLARYYREARAELIGEGRRVREVSEGVGEHRLRLGIFADAYNDGRSSWQDVREAWNNEHPEEEAEHDHKRFVRDCGAGYTALTGMNWGRQSQSDDSYSPDDKTGE
jgi:hypothetical protein